VIGILGKKLGMTQIFAEGGKMVPVTVIEAGPCCVVQVKTLEKDGYEAVKVGFNEIKKEKKVNKVIFQKFPQDIDIFIEPGRAVIGDAGIFVSTVIGKAMRGDENWLYIDVGVFNGLMESVGGIKYTYVVGSRNEPRHGLFQGQAVTASML